MISFDNPKETIVDFEIDDIEDVEPLSEHIAGLILTWLLRTVTKLVLFFAKLLWRLLKYLAKGSRATCERMWNRFTAAIAEAFGNILGKVVAFLLVAAFAMSFTANGYSISRTFSWKGIVTLYQTWK